MRKMLQSFVVITCNDRSSIQKRIHSAILFTDTSTMIDTTKAIFEMGRQWTNLTKSFSESRLNAFTFILSPNQNDQKPFKQGFGNGCFKHCRQCSAMKSVRSNQVLVFNLIHLIRV